MLEPTTLAAIVIFAATYAFIAIGKIPVYHIDRAGAALLGGSLMVGAGVMSVEEAYRAIDFDTITLLLGMMIVVANLRVSGFFHVVNNWIATHAALWPTSLWPSAQRHAAWTSASGLISKSAAP